MEVATILGISRIAVFKNIKRGKIRGHKIGRNYVIHRDHLIEDILQDSLEPGSTKEERSTIKKEIETMLIDFSKKLS